MDSFDIMNPNLDSMLPPGDVFRKTFATALMGLESKKNDGGGGGDDNMEDRYEYDVDNYEFNNLTIDRNYEHQMLANEIQRHHIEETALYQEKSQAQQWDYAMQMREIKYNSQVAAYNKSEQLYGAQIGLNQRAAGLAYQNARNVNRERQEQLAFAAAKANIDFQHKHKSMRYDRQSRRTEIARQRVMTGVQKEELTLQNQANRAKAAFESQDNLVKTLQAKGAVDARGTAGGSAAKAYQAVVAESGRRAAVMRDGVTRADSAYNLKMHGLDVNLQYKEAQFQISDNKFFSDIDALEKSYQLQTEQNAASKLSIMRAYDASLQKSEHDHFAANIAADAKRMTKPELMPAPPKPLSIPRATVLDPMVPIYGPEPVEGVYATGGGSGGGGNAITGAIGGAMTGAGIGAMFGGVGAPIGAAVGFIGGAMGIM